jgi:hypothetical protein
MSHLLPDLCEWLQHTQWALALAGSTWAYPYVQLIHFAGLSLWVGTSVAFDVRLLGAGRKRRTTAEWSDGLFLWNWIGFAIAFAGGFMLFATAATAFIINPAFLLKIAVLLPMALIVHIGIQCNARVWGQAAQMPIQARIAGLIEMLFWLAIVAAAASIPLCQR